MSQFQEARMYGVVDVPRYCQWCFRVFINQYNPILIQTSGQPMDVYWSGASLIVEMQNGQLRRYFGLGSEDFEIVYI
jgi:hypothetical protein